MALKRIKVNNTQYDINDARINGIVDNLTSTDTDKVLSANQGKILKDLIDNTGVNIIPIPGISSYSPISLKDSDGNFPYMYFYDSDFYIESIFSKNGLISLSYKDTVSDISQLPEIGTVDTGNTYVIVKDGHIGTFFATCASSTSNTAYWLYWYPVPPNQKMFNHYLAYNSASVDASKAILTYTISDGVISSLSCGGNSISITMDSSSDGWLEGALAAQLMSNADEFYNGQTFRYIEGGIFTHEDKMDLFKNSAPKYITILDKASITIIVWQPVDLNIILAHPSIKKVSCLVFNNNTDIDLTNILPSLSDEWLVDSYTYIYNNNNVRTLHIWNCDIPIIWNRRTCSGTAEEAVATMISEGDSVGTFTVLRNPGPDTTATETTYPDYCIIALIAENQFVELDLVPYTTSIESLFAEPYNIVGLPYAKDGIPEAELYKYPGYWQYDTSDDNKIPTVVYDRGEEELVSITYKGIEDSFKDVYKSASKSSAKAGDNPNGLTYKIKPDDGKCLPQNCAYYYATIVQFARDTWAWLLWYPSGEYIGSSINDSKITFTQNGTEKGSFTTNQAVASTIELADTTYDVATISTNGLMSSEDKSKLDDLSKDNYTREITLTTTWTQDTTSGYYVQDVAVAEIKEIHTPSLDVKLTGTSEEMKALLAEWTKVLSAESYNGGIKFYATEPTTQELTIIARGILSTVNIDEMTKEEAVTYFSDSFLKLDNIDSAISSTSANPVQNKVIYSELNKKQNTLVSGTSIKTLNNESLLGSGNIEIDVDGQLPVGGTSGQYLVKNSSTNYDTKWSTLDTSSFLTKSNIVNNITSTSATDALSAAQGKVLSEKIDEAVSSVYRVCGSVANYEALPTNAQVGDVYDLLDTGVNYVWTADSKWDSLAGTIDLSEYLKIEDAANTYVAKTALATVATSGSYSDLKNTPTIDSALSTTSTNAVQNKVINTALNNKLDATGTAAKATADASGNVITDTYATKTYVDEQISAALETIY